MPSRISETAMRPLGDSALFKPLKLGALTLQHRIIQAPLTRMRAVKESDGVYVHGDMNAEYYAQRASKGGFQLTEATSITRMCCGYHGVPGLFTASQLSGWKKVTDAVHAKGGYIFCQIWHVGRATAPSFLGGHGSVSSSNIPISGKAHDGTDYSDHPPRPMTVAEIEKVVQDFATAAKNAVEVAGFDGVEIHGANGYLLEQFLHDNVNIRTDAYGGSVEKRCKIVLDVIKAVTSAVGAERVGIRLSPYNYYQDTKDSNPNLHWSYLCEQLIELPIDHRPVYVHMVEPRFDEELDEGEKIASLAGRGKPSLVPFRKILEQGNIRFLAAGGFNAENAAPKVEANEADAIVFGRLFISNPDLPTRLSEGLQLNAYDRSSFYGAEPPSKGYVDYPFWEA